MTKSFIGKFLNNLTEEQWKQIELNSTKAVDNVLKTRKLFVQTIQEIVDASKGNTHE